MPPLFSRKTLQIKPAKSSPLLRGMLYFLLTLLIVIFGAEIVARSPLGNLLPAPSVGADSFVFDAKIYALEGQVRRDGKLDCLFIGSSVANTGVDPAIIEAIYKERTGDEIHCFNIGLPAMNVENAIRLSDALIERFAPRVIFYTVLSRDIEDTRYTTETVDQSDWLKYNRGEPSSNGWLVNHSYAWRYYLTWRYWLVIPNRQKMEAETGFLSPKGFQPAQGIRIPYPANLTMSPKRLSEVWSDPTREQALRLFLARQRKGVKIVLIEAPFYRDPSDSPTVEAARQIYETKYLAVLQQIANSNGVPLWRTDALSAQIPEPHWYDWVHLNSKGAVTFSQWLGERLAENEWLFK